MPEPITLTPYQVFTGPGAVDQDFSMVIETISDDDRLTHHHPVTEAPVRPAPDAEPAPTPATPTPRPDGQPPAPDAVIGLPDDLVAELLSDDDAVRTSAKQS